jgi:hypothetical protein
MHDLLIEAVDVALTMHSSTLEELSARSKILALNVQRPRPKPRTL